MKSKKLGILLASSFMALGLAACGPEESDTSSVAPSTNPDSSKTNDDSSNSGSGSSSSVADSKENLVDGYRLVTSMEEFQSASKVLIGAYSGSNLFGLTANAKSSSLPWYLVGEALQEVNSHKDVKDIGQAAIWDLSKVGESYKFSLNGKDLYSYVDGTHYSIGYEANKDGNDWTITMDSTGKSQAVSSKGVYLQYYKGSFCGASSKYKDNCQVYFYVPSQIAISKTEKPDDSTGGDIGGGTTDDTYWKGLDFKTYGNTFRGTLKGLIAKYHTKSTSYSACLEIGKKAAAYPENSSNFIPFYHASPDVKEGVSGNGVYVATSKDSINREHTWPNSRGCGKKGGPAVDPFIIRPTLSSENSDRGRDFYGVAGSNEWDPASCGYEAARGESARIIFYAATAYYGTCGSGGTSHGNKPLELSNNPRDNADEHTMGTLKSLLEWNAKYPVTKMEKQINNYLASQGYGRNPFVDHPEYANQIWDVNGIRTKGFDNKDVTFTNSNFITSKLA